VSLGKARRTSSLAAVIEQREHRHSHLTCHVEAGGTNAAWRRCRAASPRLAERGAVNDLIGEIDRADNGGVDLAAAQRRAASCNDDARGSSEEISRRSAREIELLLKRRLAGMFDIAPLTPAAAPMLRLDGVTREPRSTRWR
jgi:hypothetical protein